MTDDIDLSSLLNRPEGKTLDFKAKCYDTSSRRGKRAFAKDLASLTNTPREGDAHIVLGVKKHLDGSFELLGLDKAIDDSDLQTIAGSILEPVPQFDYQPIRHCGVLLGLITIPPDQEYPVAPRRTHGEDLVEGSIYFRRGSRNSTASTREQERIWDWFHGLINPERFDAFLREESQSTHNRIDADALLLGPIQALGLTSDVEEAQRLVSESPADAAELYEEVAQSLRDKFPGYADRFERLRATALNLAGASDASHDLLMKLAIRELFDRAEPQLSAEVSHNLEGLSKEVDEGRKARGYALMLFGRCHEYSGELEKLADSFDNLETEEEYAPFIGALLVEAALADRAFDVVLKRHESLRRLDAGGNTQIAIRIRAALGDAGVPGIWPDLISEVESSGLPSAEGTYICIRGARWYAWNGQLDRAKSLCQLAMKLGAEAGLDLDVENALWSLTALYSLGHPSEELFETNRMALSLEGSHSYVIPNSRTRQRSYQYLANGQLPNAHLWAQYRLLESIRSGCLMDELESHTILARIYGQSNESLDGQSDESLDALEHAILGGSHQLIKEMAPKVSEWPDYLPDMLISKAPWVRRTAHLALKYVGDLAPPEVARRLASELLCQLSEDADDVQTVPTLLEALGTIILEATAEDLDELIPYLERASVRRPEEYRLTDPGVMTLAARLYRFRPDYRKQAASILGEMAIGSHTGAWARALDECGDDTGELIEALIRVAEREMLDLAGPLSDLGHMNEATRALWSARLQFVSDHPLGKRSGGAIGPRYDVPAEFLTELESTASLQYVDKLVSIGSDDGELVLNRGAALAAAANAVDLLSDSDREQVFRRVLPLAKEPVKLSEMDEYQARTQHPLSRFCISLGSATDVRTSAGWLLARAAVSRGDCTAVVEIALNWVRSDDSILQATGASILTLPNVSYFAPRSSELARHKNPSVRRAALWMPGTQESPASAVFELLAVDPERRVRIAVTQALRSAKTVYADSYKRIREHLNADRSAIVRACASEL